MNLPNKLTILRAILIVPFVLILLGDFYQWGWFAAVFGGMLEYVDWLALFIFVGASITDMIDGKIARKHNLVTNFGKFMDPLADKLLVCAALICLVEMGRIPSWVVVIIISREFIISGFRTVAADKGVVIAASYWGKIKTVFQMIMIGMLIIESKALPGFVQGLAGVYEILTAIVMWIALALTVISLVDYIWKNKAVMADEK